MASLARGYEGVYHNPAALADLRRRELVLGGVVVGLDLRVDGAAHPATDPSAALVGVALPLPLVGGWDGRVGLALGVWLPTDVVVAARVPAYGTPWWPLLQDRARTVGVHLAAGVRLTPRLSVGAGFLALAALTGGIRVRPAPGGRLTARVEDELIADFAPIVGAALDAEPLGLPVRLAVVFAGESRADYAVPLDADLGEAVCLGDTCIRVPVMDISGTAQYDPPRLVADARVSVGPLALAAGFTWKRWSAYPRPARPPVPGSPYHRPPGFYDTIAPALAARWLVVDGGRGAVSLRAGAWHEPTPAPEDARPGALLDSARPAVTLGMGLRVGDGGPGTVTVDVFGQTQVLHARELETAAGRLEVDGHVEAGGLQVGVRF